MRGLLLFLLFFFMIAAFIYWLFPGYSYIGMNGCLKGKPVMSWGVMEVCPK